jgi:rod shape determining protein RodA
MTLTRKGARAAKSATGGKWRSLDPVLLLVSLALTAFGILAVYVAGDAARQTYAANQAFGFFVGLAGAVPLALIDYRFWQRHLRPIYGLVLLMLLAVLVMGVTVGGAQRWVYLGPVQVQPSEFAKLGMVIVLAGYFAEKSVGDHLVFLKALGILSIPAFLVFTQPDLGTALVFGAIFVSMAYIAGAKLIQLGGLLVAGVIAAILAVKLEILEAYQVARLTAFVKCYDKFSDLCYQVASSKMAIGSGGLAGKGLDAQTLANLGYLPAEETDFIFSNLAERVGFVGSILLIVLFFVLIWRILHVATISRDRFGVLIAVGVATVFLFHVFVNVGMTMGIMPVTGIPLPFISYGRSSLVVSVLSLGLLQSIAMHSKAEASKHPTV